MANIKNVKPAREGLVVRNPQNGFQPLPAEGQNVEWSTHWARLLRDGDIIVSAPQVAAKTKTVATSKGRTGGDQ